MGETQQRTQHLRAWGAGVRGERSWGGSLSIRGGQGGKSHIISSGSSPSSHPWVSGRTERHVRKAQGRGISRSASPFGLLILFILAVLVSAHLCNTSTHFNDLQIPITGRRESLQVKRLTVAALCVALHSQGSGVGAMARKTDPPLGGCLLGCSAPASRAVEEYWSPGCSE